MGESVITRMLADSVSSFFGLCAVACFIFGLICMIFQDGDRVGVLDDALGVDDLSHSSGMVAYLLIFTGIGSFATALHLASRRNEAGTYTWGRWAQMKWYTFEIPFIGSMAVIEILSMIIWLGLQAVTMYQYYVNYKAKNVARGRWSESRYYYGISRALAMGFAVNFSMLLIPVSKHSFWLELFDVGFERAVRIHRWLGVLTVLCVLLHGLFAIVTYTMESSLYNCMGWDLHEDDDSYCSTYLIRMNIFGQISLCSGIGLCAFSMPIVRRFSYQLFYYSHVILAFMFILFGIIHDIQSLYFLFMGLATYLVDKVISLWRRKRECSVLHYSVNDETACTKLEIAFDKASPLPRHGEWFHMNIKEAAVLEWHPISVAEVSEENHSVIFFIRQSGNWSTRVGEMTKAGKVLNLRLDGPFGGTHTRHNGYLANDSAVFVCGGIGITAHTLAVDAALQSSAFSQVAMRWFVTKQAFVDQHFKCLKDLAQRGADIQVFITRKDDEYSGDGGQFVSADSSGDATEGPENGAGYLTENGENVVVDTEKGSNKLGSTDWYLSTNGTIQRFETHFSSPLAKGFITIIASLIMFYGYIWAVSILPTSTSKDENFGLIRMEMLCIYFLVCFAGILAAALLLSFLSFARSHGVLPDRLSQIACKIRMPSMEFGDNNSTPPSFQVFVTQERPDLKIVFEQLSSKMQEGEKTVTAGVSLCGPDSLVAASRSAAASASRRGHVKFIIDAEEFTF